MKRTLMNGSAFACVLAAGVFAGSGEARADWLKSAMHEACSEQQKEKIAELVRNDIEAEVRRGEAMLGAPTPVGDLACLNDLMNAPLAVLSQIQGLTSTLAAGIQNLSNLSLNMDVDVSGMICAYAAEKWATLTKGLGASTLSVGDFASILPDPTQRASGGGQSIRGVFDGASGVSKLTDSAGTVGSVQDYFRLPTDRETIYQDVADAITIEIDPEDTAASDSALDNYYVDTMVAFARQIGCEVARAGQYWDDHGNWRPNHTNYCNIAYPASPLFLPPSNSGVRVIYTPLNGNGGQAIGSSAQSSPISTAATPPNTSVAPKASVQAPAPGSNPIWNNIGKTGQ